MKTYLTKSLLEVVEVGLSVDMNTKYKENAVSIWFQRLMINVCSCFKSERGYQNTDKMHRCKDK